MAVLTFIGTLLGIALIGACAALVIGFIIWLVTMAIGNK